uniref:Uncharacterized protein n=1 Tax=Anguilla anguilla TaxID=7936 RepID=A0A0E9XSC0_ANGAN
MTPRQSALIRPQIVLGGTSVSGPGCCSNQLFCLHFSPTCTVCTSRPQLYQQQQKKTLDRIIDWAI